MENQNKIEKLLQSFSLKSPPKGLRERILRTAHQEKMASRLMTSGLWILLVSSTLLIIFTLFLDIKISQTQQKQMASLINLPLVYDNSKVEDDIFIIAELLNEPPDSEMVSWIKRRYEMREKTKKAHKYYKTFKTLEEEFNGN